MNDADTLFILVKKNPKSDTLYHTLIFEIHREGYFKFLNIISGKQHEALLDYWEHYFVQRMQEINNEGWEYTVGYRNDRSERKISVTVAPKSDHCISTNFEQLVCDAKTIAYQIPLKKDPAAKIVRDTNDTVMYFETCLVSLIELKHSINKYIYSNEVIGASVDMNFFENGIINIRFNPLVYCNRAVIEYDISKMITDSALASYNSNL